MEVTVDAPFCRRICRHGQYKIALPRPYLRSTETIDKVFYSTVCMIQKTRMMRIDRIYFGIANM